jgi:hypothetical protein
MLHKIFRAIHYLRVYLFAFILVAFFYYLGQQPVDLAKFVGAKLSRAISMSVSVSENPYNKLALQLKDKENQLNQREQDLAVRETKLQDQNLTWQTKLILVLGAGIIVLFVLILVNFYLDYRRRQNKNTT